MRASSATAYISKSFKSVDQQWYQWYEVGESLWFILFIDSSALKTYKDFFVEKKNNIKYNKTLKRCPCKDSLSIQMNL